MYACDRKVAGSKRQATNFYFRHSIRMRVWKAIEVIEGHEITFHLNCVAETFDRETRNRLKSSTAENDARRKRNKRT